LATRNAAGIVERCWNNGNDDNAWLRSDRERSHSAATVQRATSAALGIEVKLAGAVVRVSSGMDDAAQLTAVLRAVRASASRS